MNFIVGRSVNASLVKLDIRLSETADSCNITSDLPVVCAVVDINATNYDLIFPSDVVDELNELPVISVLKPSVSVLTVDTESNVSSDVQDDVKDGQYTNGDVINVDQLTDDVNDCDVNKLIEEQKSDETLFHCWAMAREQKGGYVVSRGMLFHNDKVEGQSVCQLCVPASRRNHVLQLAHDSVFG